MELLMSVWQSTQANMLPWMESLNFAGSTYRLTGLPATSLVRVESPWQARQSSLAGFCALAAGKDSIAHAAKASVMVADRFITAALFTLAELPNVGHEFLHLRFGQLALVGRHLGFAFVGDLSELCVGLLLNLRR